MAGNLASKAGWYPHGTGLAKRRKIEKLGFSVEQKSPHHWQIKGRGCSVQWWPCRGKWMLPESETLMGDFVDLLEDLGSMPERGLCEWCDNGWPESHGYHELPAPVGKKFCSKLTCGAS